MICEEPMHPYRMQALIKERGKDQIANVAQRNSVYQTIAALSRAGLITIRETSRDERWPERTVYEVTEEGRRTLRLWLRTVLDFQQGITAALDAGDGLRAVLHTPAWVRLHSDEARLLLLYHRDDFVQGWPASLRDGVAAQTARMESGFARFARLVFGRAGPDELRRAQFLLAEMPVGAVRQHLHHREPPPPIVDELIRITYRAVVADYRARRSR